MRPTALTRRSLLAAGAGTLGGGLLARAGAASALVGAESDAAGAGGTWTRRAYEAGTVGEIALGRLGPGASSLRLERAVELLGVGWQAPRRAAIELRVRSASGAWSGWVGAGDHGHAPERAAAGAGALGEPIWTGGARELELRSASALEGVRLYTVELARSQGEAQAAALELAEPVLDAGPGQPPIIARGAWAHERCPPRVAPGYGAVELAFVHHTDNPNGYSAAEVPAMLRAIYLYHRYVRGWNDIGYNFVLDLFGRVFEARAGGIDEAVVGAQAGGYNLYSTGAAVLGSFSDRPISAPARAALEALLAWKLSLHGAPTRGRVLVQVSAAGASYSRFPAGTEVSLPRISGHRQADATDCPGDALYAQLAAIRRGAAAQAGEAVQATIALASVPGGALPPLLSEPPAAAGRYLFGTLSALDGTPLAGQQVQIQARTVARRGELVSESTLAEASTNEQGEWALPAAALSAAEPVQSLRALYPGSAAGASPTATAGTQTAAGRGYGAAVSESLRAALA